MKKFPTLQNFQMQVLKKYFYGNDLDSLLSERRNQLFNALTLFTAFSSCLITFPIHICEDDDADFEALMLTNERSIGFKSRVYANPRFKQVAMKMLPIFDRKGVLDEL
jgi:hypothetical protein